ncbi:hypothetical protein HMF7854_00175 [Sphingomonas ginkgonis]|uniref:Uncharacterized protein n=1 Tax=Sphingomonas ginkgonis TaxID=2315330 RepID=A0A3R9WLR8_9SPHN|nr:hypothetical protein [Sphingomonas ginkgonis]RST29422.1 hypothetical protein HMF7854_00175 [Sphingomonas ginkgonis]
MRYFLDTEFNGFGGALLSLALVPEHGDEELYLTFAVDDPLHPWVERHVIPYLDHVPARFSCPRTSLAHGGLAVANFLAADTDIEIVADWPEDLALFCRLLLTGPGDMVAISGLRLQLIRLPGFSVAANSQVPHNALHDARSLRDHVLANNY